LTPILSARDQLQERLQHVPDLAIGLGGDCSLCLFDTSLIASANHLQ
jgi:hypothetical protein